MIHVHHRVVYARACTNKPSRSLLLWPLSAISLPLGSPGEGGEDKSSNHSVLPAKEQLLTARLLWGERERELASFLGPQLFFGGVTQRKAWDIKSRDQLKKSLSTLKNGLFLYILQETSFSGKSIAQTGYKEKLQEK